MQQGTTCPCPDETVPQMLHEPITDRRAWKRDTLSPADWLVPLTPACVDELEAIVQFLRTYPRPVWHLTPEAFALRACTSVMAQVRDRLHQERGFAVIDRVPVERYSPTETRAMAWLLASLMGQVVAQAWDGTLLYDLKDAGQPAGRDVQRSGTRLAQDFHTDGGWLRLPPTAVGLFCLQPARQGGLSRVVSLLTVHNELQRRYPGLLARLYCPFWWDRQAEHAPDEASVSRHPVYQYDGHSLTVRYAEDEVCNGYRRAGEELDTAGAAALTAMCAIIAAPENWVEFRLEQGQLAYINNRQCAHAHTASDDAPGAAARHMLRLWNRDEGSPDLEGHEDTIDLDL